MTYHSAISTFDTEPAGPIFGEPAPRSGSATSRVASDLAALAAGMDLRFVEAGTTLMKAIESNDRLIAILKGIGGVLDGDAMDEAVATLTAMADRLGGLPQALMVREGDLSAARANSTRLKDRVDELQKFFDVLHVYGVNTKIAAGGEDEFVRFVTDINGRVDNGRMDLREISDMLNALAPSLSQAGQMVEPLRRECARIVPDVPRRLADNALALRGHMTAMGELAQSVLVIANAIQGEVATVLGALQVGDSTRQRIEHVVEALAILDAHCERTGPDRAMARILEAHVLPLLAAQLDATACDFSDGAATLLSSLRGIGPHTSRLLSLIEGQSADNHASATGSASERSVLQSVEHNIAEMQGLTNRLTENDLQSNILTDTVAETLVALGRKLRVFADLRIDVRNIAINTLVLCRRMGDSGRAVLVIAKEIDRLCGQLGTVLDSMIELVEDLSDNSTSIRATTDTGARPDLADALAIVRQGCDSNASGIERGRTEAHSLFDLLDRTGAELANELALERDILAAGEILGAISPPPVVTEESALSVDMIAGLTAIFQEIAARYTMAREREVHSLHMPPGMEIPPAVAAADPFGDDDDEDDGLF